MNISQNTFLVAHSVMEIFAIVVALMVFFITYGEHDVDRSPRSVILGYAALATGLFDMLHMLAYIGMPDLTTLTVHTNPSCSGYLVAPR